jgi:hypothetical protein
MRLAASSISFFIHQLGSTSTETGTYPKPRLTRSQWIAQPRLNLNRIPQTSCMRVADCPPMQQRVCFSLQVGCPHELQMVLHNRMGKFIIDVGVDDPEANPHPSICHV